MLRSGNGQHRKPRQAPAFVVTAGVTGAGIALPLLGATGAHAATVSTWDKVAQCESGGMWSADNGNGAYGGLQMTQDTWERFGGTAYAERPDLASRQQQITIAEKVLSAQGADAWGGCAADAGLAKGGSAADVDPGTLDPSTDGSWDDSGDSGLSNAPVLGDGSGATDSSGSSASAGSGGSSDSSGSVDASGTPSSAPSASPSPSSSASSAPSSSATGTPTPSDGGRGGHGGGRHAKPSPSASGSDSATPTPSGTPSGSPSGTPGDPASTAPGDPASTTPGDPASTMPGDRGGDRASRGGVDARQHDPVTDGQESSSYTVQPGDNLSQIATDHSVPGGWPSLFDANKSVVGSDPNLILPGQQLTLR